MNECTDGRMNDWVHGCMHEWIIDGMHAWIYGGIDYHDSGRMNVWMNTCINEWLNACAKNSNFCRWSCIWIFLKQLIGWMNSNTWSIKCGRSQHDEIENASSVGLNRPLWLRGIVEDTSETYRVACLLPNKTLEIRWTRIISWTELITTMLHTALETTESTQRPNFIG